jgi:hypothetical protein
VARFHVRLICTDRGRSNPLAATTAARINGWL